MTGPGSDQARDSVTGLRKKVGILAVALFDVRESERLRGWFPAITEVIGANLGLTEI